ncbi:hypothetical protein QQP08_009395 [Theobroma cacao]|nr:hypothetical protein QQP08_009395 [Theobroma cacao]
MEGVKTENNVKLQTYKTRWELGMGQRVFFVGVRFVLLNMVNSAPELGGCGCGCRLLRTFIVFVMSSPGTGLV